MKLLKGITLMLMLVIVSCSDTTTDPAPPDTMEPTSTVTPYDINTDGFDLLEKIQGHWVGSNLVIATNYEWFGWDFRAISPSHVHGIFQGGSQGDLFVSFFVSEYKNTRTIMARNGGVLNGIYRTSYFVLDNVEDKGSEGKYYHFVDAIGGERTTSFEIRFIDNDIYFNAYTSGLGNREPSRHMTFVAEKKHIQLAEAAAQATGFPQNVIDEGLNFADGFNTNYLYVENEGDTPKTASFLVQNNSNDVYALAPLSGDPYTISDHPRLGTIKVNLTLNSQITDDELLVYLSKDPLTDTNGYFTADLAVYDGILQFPTLLSGSTEFLFTYVHPGDYYLTVIADKNDDSQPSQGDIVSVSKAITLSPLEHKTVDVPNIDIQN